MPLNQHDKQARESNRIFRATGSSFAAAPSAYGVTMNARSSARRQRSTSRAVRPHGGRLQPLAEMPEPPASGASVHSSSRGSSRSRRGRNNQLAPLSPMASPAQSPPASPVAADNPAGAAADVNRRRGRAASLPALPSTALLQPSLSRTDSVNSFTSLASGSDLGSDVGFDPGSSAGSDAASVSDVDVGLGRSRSGSISDTAPEGFASSLPGGLPGSLPGGWPSGGNNLHYLGGPRRKPPAHLPPMAMPTATSSSAATGVELVSAGDNDSACYPQSRCYAAETVTPEQAQKAVDLNGRNFLMRKLRPGSPNTQRRAAKLKASLAADHRMIGGLATHDKRVEKLGKASKVVKAVGAGTGVILTATGVGAAAGPAVAAATVAATSGLSAGQAFESEKSAQAIDSVLPYLAGPSHLPAEANARRAQRNQHAVKAATGVVTGVADSFAPEAASTVADGIAKGVNKAMTKKAGSAQAQAAQQVLALPGIGRPRTPPGPDEFDAI